MLTGVMPLSFAASESNAASDVALVTIVNMQTDDLTNPIGIDSKTPRFSWNWSSKVVGEEQKAYQITVNDPDGRVVWDSGKVADSKSVGIQYAGPALAAATQYRWAVKVTDQEGRTFTSAPATFETGLLGDSTAGSIGAEWSGAKWIGADEYCFDAVAASVFDLQFDMTIPVGQDKASFVLGAEDFRLQKGVYNVWNTATAQNYWKFEVDITTPTAPKMNVYIVGMPANTTAQKAGGENAPDQADFTYTIPAAAVSGGVNSPLTVLFQHNDNKFTCRINGSNVINAQQLNPLGNNNAVNSFPNLNSMGFAVPAGGVATFENIRLKNPGRFNTSGILFSRTAGATYSIWNGKPGVSINNNTGVVTVNGGASGVLSYADPSYGSEPMLRTQFKADKKVKSARLYATSIGTYDMYINGEKVGDGWLNPGSNEFREEITYQSYDVTDLVSKGNNAMGAQLSEGWFSGYMTYDLQANYNYYSDKQALLAKLVITYTDGTTKTVVTDETTWDYYGRGPVEYGSLYMGERYNAATAKTLGDWSMYNYNLSGWRDAAVFTPTPFLTIRSLPPALTGLSQTSTT
jgi:alpha-L-rhamnosidase